MLLLWVIVVIEKGRTFLKAADHEKLVKLEEEHPEFLPDQMKKIPPPPYQKDYPKDAELIDLVAPEDFTIGQIPLLDAINRRKSHRGFTKDSLTVEELSFLLWTTQGIREIKIDHRHGKVETTKRTVPSGGSRHPYETYLLVNRVDGLQPGIYRYLAIEHKLYCVKPGEPDFPDRMTKICGGQTFAGRGAVVFIWAIIPYRIEWRYSIVAHKGAAIEAGHICQNLYLACEAIGAGTCAIAAYDQKSVDAFIGVDGKDEFTVYISPVGKIP